MWYLHHFVACSHDVYSSRNCFFFTRFVLCAYHCWTLAKILTLVADSWHRVDHQRHQGRQENVATCHCSDRRGAIWPTVLRSGGSAHDLQLYEYVNGYPPFHSVPFCLLVELRAVCAEHVSIFWGCVWFEIDWEKKLRHGFVGPPAGIREAVLIKETMFFELFLI